MKSNKISRAILPWYSKHARQLPWRDNPDPYTVWISEVMLQQTRADTVIPYFERWMKQYPTIDSLASASQHEVLVIWEGLGYYSRARNLLRTAKIVMNEMGGKLPNDARSLRRFPGIGKYTAGAIASIAYGLDEPVIDGNISRVLSRVFSIRKSINSNSGKELLWQIAKSHLPPGKASEYNQALMELGATICTPRSPACHQCPLAQFCQANKKGIQEEFPIKKKKGEIPFTIAAAAVIQYNHEILISRRPQDGLLGGMWQFPGCKLELEEEPTECLKREILRTIGVEIDIKEPMGVYNHAYTHFQVKLHAYWCELFIQKHQLPVKTNTLHWIKPLELPKYPMGKIDRQIANFIISKTAS